MERKKFDSREEWLAYRINGIGASEAAQACGLSPFGNQMELWKVKMGMKKPDDLSQNEAVQRGIRLEPVIRKYFQGVHDEYNVEYNQFDIVYQESRPWLFATLDGELIRKKDGKRGILEIKTGSMRSWKDWRAGGIPKHYYCQAIHQLLATGFEHVVVFARLLSMNGDETLVCREVWREEVEEDMKWLLEKETWFWKRVQVGKMPESTLLVL